MKVITGPAHFQKIMEKLREQGKTLGFVPTMGALHEGHLELVRRSCRQNDVTAVSIFVNPAQFGPKEDFSRYPRPLKRDKALLRQVGADYLFLPSVEAMYPAQPGLIVDWSQGSASDLAKRYCGRSRPGHFRGVLTVCAKLFNLARPHRVYLGAKDYQQTVVLSRLIGDLHMGIRMVRVPTVRDPDGLALSSRNVYLSAEERQRALVIPRVLAGLRTAVAAGRGTLPALLTNARRELARAVDRVDYLEAADGETLEPLRKARKNMVILTACFVGKTRLIDNVIIPAFRRHV